MTEDDLPMSLISPLTCLSFMAPDMTMIPTYGTRYDLFADGIGITAGSCLNPV